VELLQLLEMIQQTIKELNNAFLEQHNIISTLIIRVDKLENKCKQLENQINQEVK
jgi:uncharacterized coiled-coil protein SlyX